MQALINGIRCYCGLAAVLWCLVAQPAGAAVILTDNSDWPLYGRTFDNQRFSPLSQVNAGNVERLRPGLAIPDRQGRIVSVLAHCTGRNHVRHYPL